jgi:hypothetical protein
LSRIVSVPEYEIASVGLNCTAIIHIVSVFGTPFPPGFRSSSLHCVVTENGDGVGMPSVLSISITIGGG